MTLSTLTYAANGLGPYPIHALDYLSTAHLSVTVNGVPASATFDDAKKLMTLVALPAAGASVVIHRTTPRLREQRLTQFLALPTGHAGLNAALLDQDYRQLMMALGEGRDAIDAQTLALTGMGLAADLGWNATGVKVENLALASNPADMVRKSQVDAITGAPRLLPTVSGADNDDGLFVTAGEFAKRSPTQARTHLGLGSAALLTAGVAANNAVQLDSSARYPAADGRNIDVTAHPDVLKRALATVVRWGGATDIASPGVDVSLATWSQNSSSRVPNATDWAARVELNNGGAIDGSGAAPRRISLAAGTWRIAWLFKSTMPTVGNATNATSLRITNDDDTSAQTIYYDLGIHRPNTDFSGTDYSYFRDSIVLTFGAPSFLVFRYSNKASGGSNKCQITFFFQKLV